MKIGMHHRVLSGLLGAILLVQPLAMMPLAVAADAGPRTAPTADAAATRMIEKLKAAKTFDLLPDAADEYQRWGSFLAALDQYLPVLERQEKAEKLAVDASREHLQKWAAQLTGKTVDAALKTAVDAEKQAREEWLGALAKQQECADATLKEAARARGYIEQFKASGKLDWQILAAAAKIELKLRFQGEIHDLGSSLRGVLKVLQMQVLTAYKFPEAESMAAMQAMAALDRKMSALSDGFDETLDSFLLLAQIPLASLRSFDADKEGRVLEAASALVTRIKRELKDKTDANSRAHLDVLQRVESLLTHQSSIYEEITGTDLEGVATGSFLETPAADQVSGQWKPLTDRHGAIVRDLTARLKEKDTAVAGMIQALPTISDTIGGSLKSIDFSRMGLSADDLAFVPQVRADVLTRVTAVQVLNREREAALTALKGLGKAPFENPDLTSRVEAGLYDKLGVTFSLLLHQGQDLARMASAAAELIRASKDPNASKMADAAVAAIAPVKAGVEKIRELARADEQALNQLRQLALDMSRAYSAQAVKLSTALSAAMAGADAKGRYQPVVKVLTDRLAYDATVLKGLDEALAKVMPKSLPEITPEWIGACGLGRSMARGLVRGSYMETRAVESVTAALKGSGSELADKLAVLDLALAIDFPVDLAVAPDGIRIGVGDGAAAVQISGVGNVDVQRLAAAGNVVPDFTLRGSQMGGFWGNAWEGFKSAAGAVKDGAVAVGGFIKDTAIKIKDNFVSDPTKWIELGFYAAVGALVLAGTITTAPAWLVPAIGVFIASEVLGAVVDVAKDRKWINDAWEKTLKLGITIAGIVVGAVWEKGLKLGWEGLKTFHKDLIKNIKMFWPRLKHFPKAVWDFVKGTNLIKNIKRIKDFLDSYGGLKNVKDLLDTVWTWVTQGPGGSPGTGPGGTPGTGLPHPGDGGDAEQKPGVGLQPLR